MTALAGIERCSGRTPGPGRRSPVGEVDALPLTAELRPQAMPDNALRFFDVQEDDS